ncbi:MAG: glucose-1-phosphate cytidylyltransferase [Acidobacteria bacterium]|nr:glucose-1-phosphate cytidylyltransferase [Acidobacteriota bacterium]
MKVVLFCGGAGMRLRGYSDDVPKPMVTIGSRPIMWHLMKYYAHYGHKDFILCLGYKGSVIKDYFLHYDEGVSNDFVLSQGGRKVTYLHRDIDDWTITFVQTGLNATIAERLKAVEPYLKGEEAFLANYSDGLTDLPLPVLIEEFKRSNALGYMLLVQPKASFNLVSVTPDGVVQDVRGMDDTDLWINGGFFVFRNEIFRYIQNGEELVQEPFQRLIERRTLRGYQYRGFWGCMDTFKEKQYLEELENNGAPWKVWCHKPRRNEDITLPDNEWAVIVGGSSVKA